MTPTKPRKAATKKPTTTPTPAKTPGPETLPGIAVGRVVEHTFTDVRTGREVTETGIVVKITDDGAYVAALSTAAVVPLDRLKAV